jgi:cobalt-zinc-cadmium efflux system outer membrane protein
MQVRTRFLRFASLALWLLATGAAQAQAQQAQIDVGGVPELPPTRLKLGRPLGALGAPSLLDTQSNAPISGRAGPAGARAPVQQFNPGSPAQLSTMESRIPEPLSLPESKPPTFGSLGEPLPPPEEGGITLEQAINILVQRNLSLLALQYEIPMSRADVLTASLRANPVFYADSQLVPYGIFSNARPGGQTQYDVNINWPIDFSRKRQARTVVAEKALKVTEAQFQDAVRLQIDNLYTVIVDVAAANEAVRYNEAYSRGLNKLAVVFQERAEAGAVQPSQADALRAQAERAQLQLRLAKSAVASNTRKLALLLNMRGQEAASLKVSLELRDTHPLPEDDSALLQRALENRPDLVANRFGLQRSSAEIRLAKANAYPDAYLLYQPYTLQDNRPLGLKSPTSWAVGLTVSVPLFNRNQGNVQRARLNEQQTRVELAAAEEGVATEVDLAIREFLLSLSAVEEIEKDVLPAAQRVYQSSLKRFNEGLDTVDIFSEAQRDYNETIRDYRDALVRHRRAVLDLNTAIGVRLLP